MLDTVIEIIATLGFFAVAVLAVVAFAIGDFTFWTGVCVATVMCQAVALFLQAYLCKKIEKK